MSSEEEQQQEFKALILGPGTPLGSGQDLDEEEPSTSKPGLAPLDEDDPTFAQPNVPQRNRRIAHFGTEGTKVALCGAEILGVPAWGEYELCPACVELERRELHGPS